MQRTLRLFLCQCLLAGLALPLAAAAQETRGKISGTVRDSSGVIPGASVKVTNVDTERQPEPRHQRVRLLRGAAPQSRHLRRDRADGRVQDGRRDGIVLGVGQQVNVPFTLEVGEVTEEVIVTAETPLLDTTSRQSAAHFDTRLVESLPMFSNMPITLSRFAPGTNVERSADAGVAGLRRQHVAVGWLGTRAAARRHAADAAELRRQQLHARRRQQQRQQPPHRHLAQLRHDPGDARRVVELRRGRRARPRPADLDDDARRHEHGSAAPSTTSTGRTGSTRLTEQQKLTFDDRAQERVRARGARTTCR